MPPTILMSGPIRPSESDVVSNVALLRRQFPGSRIFLSTWTESPAVRAAVDVYDVCPEPPAEEIRRIAPTTTRTHVESGAPDTVRGGRLSTFRMVYGVERVCTLARPYLTDADLVLRIRTDSFFTFDPGYLRELLSSPPQYLAKRLYGFDWFAMTTFGCLRQVWIFRDLQQYTNEVSQAWNPEELILKRVPVPITYLDKSRVDMYVLNQTREKVYFND